MHNVWKRELLYQIAFKKLSNPNFRNLQVIKHHLFRLKVNDDFVINSKQEIEDLVVFINNNYE